MGSRMTESDREALNECAALGLHPKLHPMGDDHHTDAKPTAEDQATGDALSYFLGGLFCDKDEEIEPDSRYGDSYFYKGMTSVDVWTRVVRALRVHGLKITDA
jgi:hypothetical protein